MASSGPQTAFHAQKAETIPLQKEESRSEGAIPSRGYFVQYYAGLDPPVEYIVFGITPSGK